MNNREVPDCQPLVDEITDQLERGGRLKLLKDFVQHGDCSVYAHSRNVAELSLRMARRLPFRLDYRALVRGALLHDYFLYDWHKPDPKRRKHAFFHPSVAWQNAREDYALGRVEEDIIRHHMFPVVPVPPRTAEGWIVNVADTLCALGETMGLKRFHPHRAGQKRG